MLRDFCSAEKLCCLGGCLYLRSKKKKKRGRQTERGERENESRQQEKKKKKRASVAVVIFFFPLREKQIIRHNSDFVHSKRKSLKSLNTGEWRHCTQKKKKEIEMRPTTR